MDELMKLRKKIDELDEQLLIILKKRFEAVAQVGRVKKKLSLPPLDQNRWSQVVERVGARGTALGLSRQCVIKILDTIHKQALLIEEKIQHDK